MNLYGLSGPIQKRYKALRITHLASATPLTHLTHSLAGIKKRSLDLLSKSNDFLKKNLDFSKKMYDFLNKSI
jgi:hypothetical protein